MTAAAAYRLFAGSAPTAALAVLLLLGGCDQNLRMTQTISPFAVGLSAPAAGQLSFQLPQGRLARVAFDAGGSASCLPDEGVLGCTPSVGTVNGTAALGLVLVSRDRVLWGSGEVGSGSLLGTPIDVEARFTGFRPAWSDCRRIGYTEDSRDKLGRDVELAEAVQCDPLTPRPAGADAALVETTMGSAQRPGTLQTVVVSSNGDYPLEVVLRTRLPRRTGWVRIDADCALPGWTGQPAYRLSAREDSSLGHVMAFAIDRQTVPAGNPADARVELLVRPIGVGSFGVADLVATVDTAGAGSGSLRSTRVRVPVGNAAPLQEGRFWRALALPPDASAATRVFDEIVDEPDLGTCSGEFITVHRVRAASGAAVARVGEAVEIDVLFSAPVVGSGLSLLLETGRSDRRAAFVGGAGTDTLRFRYVVQAGDQAVRLDVHSVDALLAGGDDLRGAGGRGVDLSLPAPGSADSLSASVVQIDGG